MKNLFLFLSLILLCSCNSDDDVSFNLENKTYKIVAFNVESNMDLNGDGIFSTDLLSELDPYDSDYLRGVLSMTFQSDGTVLYPFYDWPTFWVVNGEQISTTTSGSFSSCTYRLNAPNIQFLYEGILQANGELFNDGTTIVTSYDPNIVMASMFIGDFINETGEIEAYTGRYILTFELQN
jgi:hypothetical protein